ncbi:glutamate dehydrogenase [Leucosporidium creatinivorum]|uniref:Glutamate dehydrogenase n=1 Tax=Leucosporidium creatinivorum TaxID=106004 RepID=A0A1Y2EDE0_9BASI|nr:glutamate dehydrogenase [Leucosporidium creatinivorum]
MSSNHSVLSEPEFEQAVHEIESTLAPLFKEQPELERAFKVLQVPERVLQFRVVWEDDKGNCHVNRGYRVQFSSVLGPYKGGLRLHPSVNLSILKFLGFEQIFKNALTGLHMGGGKGGCDFDPKGKSDNEIRRFCYAFMKELARHIGPNTDVPAGDIGVGGREVAYMFGAYKALRNEWSGILTGKGYDFGGSKIRPEATGYGLVYYSTHLLREFHGQDWQGKRVALSGSGNVAQYAALKVIELGGIVVSLSDSRGALIATGSAGFTADLVAKIGELKLKGGYLVDLGELEGFKYLAGQRPWTQFKNLDVALPSATQNEISGEEAKFLVEAGVLVVAEGSNMGSTQEAIDVFEAARASGKGVNGNAPVTYGPGKAANCGGVAVSGLEMAQNSQRIQWTEAEVDDKLKNIMEDCYNICFATAKRYAKEGEIPSIVQGANIAGFLKVATAARQTGDWW